MVETDSEGFVTGDFEIPEGEFAVWGVAHANPDHADDLEELYSRTMRHALTEPGSIHYCICRIEGTNRFPFFERYASKAAFEEHVKLPLMDELFSRDLMRGCTDVAFAVPSSMPAPRESASVDGVSAVDQEKYEAYLNELGPLPEQEFAIYGTVTVDSGHADVQAQAFADASRLADAEPGVLYHCVFRDDEDPCKVHVFERYARKAAFQQFHKHPMVKQMFAAVFARHMKMVVSKPIRLAA